MQNIVSKRAIDLNELLFACMAVNAWQQEFDYGAQASLCFERVVSYANQVATWVTLAGVVDRW